MKYEYSNDTLSHRLKVLRAESRLSQKELAEKAGVDINSIARYESGKNTPQLDTAYLLAIALDCKIDDLVALPEPAERI